MATIKYHLAGLEKEFIERTGIDVSPLKHSILKIEIERIERIITLNATSSPSNLYKAYLALIKRYKQKLKKIKDYEERYRMLHRQGESVDKILFNSHFEKKFKKEISEDLKVSIPHLKDRLIVDTLISRYKRYVQNYYQKTIAVITSVMVPYPEYRDKYTELIKEISSFYDSYILPIIVMPAFFTSLEEYLYPLTKQKVEQFIKTSIAYLRLSNAVSLSEISQYEKYFITYLENIKILIEEQKVIPRISPCIELNQQYEMHKDETIKVLYRVLSKELMINCSFEEFSKHFYSEEDYTNKIDWKGTQNQLCLFIQQLINESIIIDFNKHELTVLHFTINQKVLIPKQLTKTLSRAQNESSKKSKAKQIENIISDIKKETSPLASPNLS